MKLAPAICIGGYEIANANRVIAYGAHELFNPDCTCPALDGDAPFVSPAADPAPWYDSSHPESADFLGFLPSSITLSNAATRPVTARLDEGSVVGAENLPGRIVEVVGWMIARDAHALWWGERWLTEALRGSMCKTGCNGDELNLLPFCRDDDTDADFRNLVGAALVDGPRFADLYDDLCYVIETAQFQFASVTPWLYSPASVDVDDETVASGDTGCTLIETDTWMDGEALTVRIDAPDGVDSGGVTLSMTISLDGTCPEDRILPWSTQTVLSMDPESWIEIDAVRRRVVYYDPTGHRQVPGFDRMEWTRGDREAFGGAFCWPVVPACSSVCVCLGNNSTQDVTWKVSRSKREL